MIFLITIRKFFKNRELFQGFAVFPIGSKDLSVYLIDFGSESDILTLVGNNIAQP